MSRLTLVAFLAMAVQTLACGADDTAREVPSHPRVGATGPVAVTAAPPGPPGAAEPASSATPIAPSAPSAHKTNVIVISIDAFRADHAPWLGYDRQVTPNLSELAKRSARYSRAYSVSSYTAMSMAGFLAGRYPGELKRNGSFFSEHPDEELFFPELLQAAGVRTIAAHAHFYFDRKAGFRQGFDVYEMVPGIKVDATTDKSITSPQHTELAIELLGKPENTGGQFFAWFHFMDPHDVYNKHEGYPQFGRGGQADRYDGELYFTDAHLKKLLDFVAAEPWGKHTALIVTADHGEAFGEHKMSRHGFELWEPLVHVPLLIALPGGDGRTIDTPRSHIDLAPTIFELLGVKAPASFRGTSLLAEARGEAEPAPRDVICDLPRTRHNWRRRALVHGQHKIIAFGDDFRFELYDVVADRAEAIDLRPKDKPLFDAMKKRYLDAVAPIKDICPSNTNGLRGKGDGKKC